MGGPGSSLSITVIAASSRTGKNRLVSTDVWSLLSNQRRVGERGTGQTLLLLLLHPASKPPRASSRLCPSGSSSPAGSGGFVLPGAM